jgi:hypothetical protein
MTQEYVESQSHDAVSRAAAAIGHHSVCVISCGHVVVNLKGTIHGNLVLIDISSNRILGAIGESPVMTWLSGSSERPVYKRLIHIYLYHSTPHLAIITTPSWVEGVLFAETKVGCFQPFWLSLLASRKVNASLWKSKRDIHERVDN